MRNKKTSSSYERSGLRVSHINESAKLEKLEKKKTKKVARELAKKIFRNNHG
jgi:hypothetical protein